MSRHALDLKCIFTEYKSNVTFRSIFNDVISQDQHKLLSEFSKRPFTLCDLKLRLRNGFWSIKIFFDFFVLNFNPRPQIDDINKCISIVTTLLWNKVLWLCVAHQMTSFNQYDCIISESSSYWTVKFYYDISWFLLRRQPSMPKF